MSTQCPPNFCPTYHVLQFYLITHFVAFFDLCVVRGQISDFFRYVFCENYVFHVCTLYVYKTFDSHQWYFYWKENIPFASTLVIFSKLFRLYGGNMGHGTIKDWASYMVMSYAIMNFRISFLEGSEGKFLGQNVVHANFHTSQTCIVGQ